MLAGLRNSVTSFKVIVITRQITSHVDEIKAGETDNVDVSLITGKIRATHIVEDDSDTKNRQMAVYSAGDYFNNRSWKGLDDGYHQDDSLEVKEGLTGIAREYSSESR